MNDDIVIKVRNVNKTFILPHEKTNSIKDAAINFYKRNKSYEKQKVLDDISFEIKKGQFFGIVGRNGSGKSTLLKLLAGIYTPDSGTVEVKGKLTPFIELGVGFSPELTGRENVFLNGALLGFNRSEMELLYDDIVAFAELERFMDQKLKNYSSGMQVRLAFSIAIRAESDILLIDEVLAVGDTAFQRKCFEHFMKLKKENRTVVLVTHDMAAVERFCDQALVINKSKFMGIFKPREASVLYEKLNQEDTVASDAVKASDSGDEERKDRWGNGVVRVDAVKVRNSKRSYTKNAYIEQGDDLTVQFDLSSAGKKEKEVVVGLALYDQFGVNISGPNSLGMKALSGQSVTYKVSRLPLNPGPYKLTVAVFGEDLVQEFDHIENAMKITVTADDHQLHGKVNLFGEWESHFEKV